MGGAPHKPYPRLGHSPTRRCVIHTEDSVGIAKTTSARQALERANSHVRYVEHNLLLDASNALDTLRPYDIIVDCTDNVPTRYLLNDACVMLGKPLVSGSALRFDGQSPNVVFALLRAAIRK
ncbi:hypothetical protein AMAG_19987 [Allomyces macrogynus ATCC 38327]|uniref:THIF-type NAD/FAD binding fold domain-containing protein n=1 Tax=Allomyces macrogynus (strain ATCC 38327) TaxID=578462 RepID=A0A0L0T468_ALLM3|nr:hypothetical protein AMAG_19987 [Allomyces macrogynus ATCC 38327]|eukprot:KNE69522.1 hypothetical protein AMAG_19987 [Allomyces macrogynus ATCC 38327]